MGGAHRREYISNPMRNSAREPVIVSIVIHVNLIYEHLVTNTKLFVCTLCIFALNSTNRSTKILFQVSDKKNRIVHDKFVGNQNAFRLSKTDII